MMKKILLLGICGLTAALFAAPPLSEITVDLKLDQITYVVGERVRGVVDVRNMSPDKVSVGYLNSEDRFIIEVFRSIGGEQLTRLTKTPITAGFRVDSNEGQKLEVFLGDHFDLSEERRYLARPVLIHSGVRYEGQLRAFDIVPGMFLSRALQIFSNEQNLNRQFELVRWTRGDTEHHFLKSQDTGASERHWTTFDLGAVMKITKPTVSIMSDGKVVVFHRLDPDYFVRSEFWSLPTTLEFREHVLVRDPETAGQARVQELYKEKGVPAKSNPWWKFW